MQTPDTASIKAATPAFNWAAWQQPDAAYTHCPFWFWNDQLEEAEIIRQIDDFRAHGVEAFVIHPRIGLPRTCGWLSDELFHFMRVALAHAHANDMWVLLYDEGMYPSGSASGLVVASNPEFKARGMVCQLADTAQTDAPPNALRLQTANGSEVLIYDKSVHSVVRGLHYTDNPDNPAVPFEDEPPAADLLNPQAVQCFMQLTYERFYAELGEFFGNTVKGIFTDEPHPLSRLAEHGVMPGTLSLLPQVNAYLGYDFTPHLPALWDASEPQAEQHRSDYRRAIAAQMNECYYRPLSRWCEQHGIALTGHPAEPDDIGNLRHLQIPGQDIVWRQILPATASALEGAPSTMAKAAASVKFHLGRSRNLNEFAGAYGEGLTFRELRWLASWLLIRGCDMLVPHAFYYSMRGARRNERPPNLGHGSAWWGKQYKEWEAQTRRLCWLNATGTPVCEVAILGSPTSLPWRAAKACFQHQIDFHYIEPADLHDARTAGGELAIGNGRYKIVIVEQGHHAEAALLPKGVNVLHWDEPHCMQTLLARVKPVITLAEPALGLRARRLRMSPSAVNENASGHGGQPAQIVLLFNESEEKIRCRPMENAHLLDLGSGALGSSISTGNPVLEIAAHDWAVLLTTPSIMHFPNA